MPRPSKEPGYRFYALYDEVYRADLLQHAWRLVRSNKGALGIDGVSLADIEAEEGVEKNLEESACLDMKHIGKPCTGKPYARFDEGGQGYLSSTLRAPGMARSALTGAVPVHVVVAG